MISEVWLPWKQFFGGVNFMFHERGQICIIHVDDIKTKMNMLYIIIIYILYIGVPMTKAPQTENIGPDTPI